jgi:putative inorganic carbon (hco3(-)) transporter
VIGFRESAPSRRSIGWPTRRAWHVLIPACGLLIGAVVAAQPLLALAGVSVIFMGVVIARRPDWATLAAGAVLYSNAAVVAHRVHGLPKVAAQAAMLLLFVALLHHLVLRRRPILLPAALPWVVAFLLVQFVGAATSVDPMAALESVQDFITGGLLLFLAFANAIRTSGVLRNLIWTLLVVGALIGSLSLHQGVTKSYGNDYLGFAQVSEKTLQRYEADTSLDATEPRLAGPIGETNYYAQVMFVLGVGGALIAAGHPRLRARLAAAGLSSLIIAGGALTFSRGGAVGVVLALLILTGLRYVRLRHLALVAVGFVVLLSIFPRYGDRLQTVTTTSGLVSEDQGTDEVDGATMGRMGSNMAALRVFAAHPVVGVGSGMFNAHYREQAIEANFKVHEGPRGAHNLYLGVLAEFGVLGFVALCGAVVVTLREVARARRRSLGRHPELAVFSAAVLGAIVTYLTTGIFLTLAYERYFWFLMALAAAAAAVSTAQPPAETETVPPPASKRRMRS